MTATVIISNLLGRIKAAVREQLTADRLELLGGEYPGDDQINREIYRDYRRFVHRNWPSIRRGEIEAAYASWLNDLVADQSSTFALCVAWRQRCAMLERFEREEPDVDAFGQSPGNVDDGFAVPEFVASARGLDR